MNLTENSTSPNPIGNVTIFFLSSSSIYLTVYSINIILGFPIHSYVLWLICTEKGSGIVAEFFTLNLTICEIVFGVGCAFFLAASKFPALAKVFFFFIVQATTARPLINCVICIERYLAVLHPISFLKYKPLRYRLPCSAVIWLMVFGLAMFFRLVILSNNMYIFLCVYLPLYSVLFFVKLFCCLAVYNALKVSGPVEKRRKREESNQIKRKAMICILIITATMFFQYSPFFLAGSFYKTLSQAQFELFWCIGVVIFMLMAYVNPLLYIHRVKKL